MKNPMMHSIRQRTTLAANGTFNYSPGSDQYFCQGHSTLVIVVCADLTRGLVLAAPASVAAGDEWHDNGLGDGAPRRPVDWDDPSWQFTMARDHGWTERLVVRLFPDGLQSAAVRVHQQFGGTTL